MHYRVEDVRGVHPVGEDEDLYYENEDQAYDKHSHTIELVSVELLRTECQFEHYFQVNAACLVVRPGYVIIGHL